jgi:hypothetical protein
MRWLVILALVGGCKKPADAPPPEEAPQMPAVELKRDQDACNTYVAKICACVATQPAMRRQCELARALPDALQVSIDVASNPASSRRDAVQAQHSVRTIAKECIEETAKLAAAGCH